MDTSSLPPQFDASADVVEQLEAVSKDETKVPHFVVRRRDIGYDGTNPTLLTAYGGFQVSETKDYSASSASFGWSSNGGLLMGVEMTQLINASFSRRSLPIPSSSQM